MSDISDKTGNSPDIDPEEFIREQYRIAAQFPGEWVVLVGLEVYGHSPDRKKAAEMNQAVYGDPKYAGRTPIGIPPDSKFDPDFGVFRGRSFAGELPYDDDLED